MLQVLYLKITLKSKIKDIFKRTDCAICSFHITLIHILSITLSSEQYFITYLLSCLQIIIPIVLS